MIGLAHTHTYMSHSSALLLAYYDTTGQSFFCSNVKLLLLPVAAFCKNGTNKIFFLNSPHRHINHHCYYLHFDQYIRRAHPCSNRLSLLFLLLLFVVVIFARQPTLDHQIVPDPLLLATLGNRKWPGTRCCCFAHFGFRCVRAQNKPHMDGCGSGGCSTTICQAWFPHRAFFTAQGYVMIIMTDPMNFVYRGGPLPPTAIIIANRDGPLPLNAYYNDGHSFSNPPELLPFSIQTKLLPCGRN